MGETVYFYAMENHRTTRPIMAMVLVYWLVTLAALSENHVQVLLQVTVVKVVTTRTIIPRCRREHTFNM